ncbi:MAG: hypothetical protein ACO2PM_19545 [Pyrobaculum sp.]|jgi:hypothetical protein
MVQVQTSENKNENQPILHLGVVARGTPAVLTSGGEAKRLVFIRSKELSQQLQQFLNAGARRVEVTVLVDGLLLTFETTIVKRGTQPLYLHPIGEAGKFLAELYRSRRAASGRKHNSVPLLILNVVPLFEKTGGRGGV